MLTRTSPAGAFAQGGADMASCHTHCPLMKAWVRFDRCPLRDWWCRSNCPVVSYCGDACLGPGWPVDMRAIDVVVLVVCAVVEKQRAGLVAKRPWGRSRS